jgi:chemotaxis protein methyltransferase CheR
MGNAGLGGASRRLRGGAPIGADCAKDHPPVLRRSPVTPADYEYLRKLLKDRSGLILGSDKQYLVESRLLPVARRVGVAGLNGLMQKLQQPNNEALVVEVVEAMATKESLFFRDKIPFDHFRDTIMPALLAARAKQKRIRIWCAAASTGQEPYSLAMCLKEMDSRLAGWRTEILATDLSLEVLEKAKAGIYSQFEVQRGLPIQMLVKYFIQIGEMWQIAPEIRAMVQYQPFNLLRDCAQLGYFDVVFCRNVLIYFDQKTKIEVLDRISRVIVPDGYLVLGAAETVVGLTNSLRPIPDKRALYGPNSGQPAAGFPRIATAGGAAR